MMGCLTVKLSAEVCDLSEDMRGALDKGAAQVIALLAEALERGRDAEALTFSGSAQQRAQVLYVLWLGASLQAKVSRSGAPLETRWRTLKKSFEESACRKAALFYFAHYKTTGLLRSDYARRKAVYPAESGRCYRP